MGKTDCMSVLAMLGNWKNLSISDIRLDSRYTMNKGFFSSFAYVIQILPYLYHKYHKNGVKLNFAHYSHNYGSYPNFDVFGKYIKLNYEPTISSDDFLKNSNVDELIDLAKIFKNYCGGQNTTDGCENFYSYKDNFALANQYFNIFFKIDESIIEEKNKFIFKFEKKKTLGIQLRGTDKLKVNWSQHISDEILINILRIHLEENNYENIFIATDSKDYIKLIKNKFGKTYKILFLEMVRNNLCDSGMHFNILANIEKTLVSLKKTEAPQ